MADLFDGILCGNSIAYLEGLEEEIKGRQDPEDVKWQNYFASVESKNTETNNVSYSDNYQENPGEFAINDPELGSQNGKAELLNNFTRDSVQAVMFIRAYRVRGHLNAKLDPLELSQSVNHPELDPDNYGFPPERRNHPVYIAGMLGLQHATINEIIDILHQTYCGTIGFEFMHISNPEEKKWLLQWFEGAEKEVSFTAEGKKAILKKLVQAESFENMCHLKFTGTKRFGLDGGEAMIPALEQIIKRGGNLGIKEIIIGMPHRGRLNVITSVMNKPYRAVFNEFEGGSSQGTDVEGSGDVKYHLGASSDREFDGNKVHLSLTANPSHLESVDPVVLGKVRAKQDQRDDRIVRNSVLPLMLHGDAAFAGQGIVPECFGLSSLRGHRVGGSIHFIVNNQIGFTTDPRFSRSSPYPSDVAKMVDAPIIHVNGDDPEAVVFAVKIAVEFRQKFGKPVVVDMFCFRRFGHNEGDEPMFTQPLMYKKIAEHRNISEIYAEKLVAEGVIEKNTLAEWTKEFREELEIEFNSASSYQPDKADWFDGKWQGLRTVSQDDALAHNSDRRGDTSVSADKIRGIGSTIYSEPENLTMHRTLKRVLKKRREAVSTGKGIDWATAESLAFATLLSEGTPVRLSGQDCERGTFSQRHSVIHDQTDGKRLIPLDEIAKAGNTRFEVINSMLSELAVLGFEYGYTLAEPDALTMWEAQFGDFANGAQIIIDQFIASGQHKWLRSSGLVMLLPHGYEGQGPEHSSARIERYLQLCAEDNMQVANCTTPANYFHILRRQIRRQFRIPLVLVTPKSLLRHRLCVSNIEDMAEGSAFHRVLPDDAARGNLLILNKDSVGFEKIRKVLICSGKVYYDLFEERAKRNINDVYLMRLEQIYPFAHKTMVKELSQFKNAEIIWVQEEPQNMGAWTFVEPRIAAVLDDIDRSGQRPAYIGRKAAASTATGLKSVHDATLRNFLDESFS